MDFAAEGLSVGLLVAATVVVTGEGTGAAEGLSVGQLVAATVVVVGAGGAPESPVQQLLAQVIKPFKTQSRSLLQVIPVVQAWGCFVGLPATGAGVVGLGETGDFVMGAGVTGFDVTGDEVTGDAVTLH